jgi:hypothetical protein
MSPPTRAISPESGLWVAILIVPPPVAPGAQDANSRLATIIADKNPKKFFLILFLLQFDKHPARTGQSTPYVATYRWLRSSSPMAPPFKNSIVNFWFFIDWILAKPTA